MEKSTIAEEAEQIVSELAQTTEVMLDGKSACRRMKNDVTVEDSEWTRGPHTWAGGYFENYGIQTLIDRIGGDYGPDYKHLSEIDYQRDYLWDFKCHSTRCANGSPNTEKKLNSGSTFAQAVQEEGALGFIVLETRTIYEDKCEDFTFWYQRLKGKDEKPRRYTGHRAREAVSISAYFIDGLTDLAEAIEEGWIRARKSSSGKQEYYLKLEAAKEADAAIAEHKF